MPLECDIKDFKCDDALRNLDIYYIAYLLTQQTLYRLLLTGKLMEHLHEIDRTANERLDHMIPLMKEQEGVTEQLKAVDQLGWVARMNSIKHRVEETILDELIYA